MSRGRLSKLTRMSRNELQWRAGTAVRNAVQRARARVQQPAWNRRDLADRLTGDSTNDGIRRALDASVWSEAHTRLAESIAQRPARFAIAPSMREALSARIKADFPGAALDAASRAEPVVAGEYHLLGYQALRFDAAEGSPDWHLDPVHDRRPPRAFWSTVPFLDPRCGDHKIIWELNRQQHLLVLGRAFWLTGDERYRDVAIEHLLSWIRANPPLVGINWASMLELGFRTLSWVWAVNFFVREPAQEERPWLVDVLLALDRQLAHIAQNLSYYFSPNTHLLGEALALYVAGQTFPLLAESDRYADVGRRVLVEQIDRQMGRDGGHLERSTHYHRYTLDFYILALIVARITADPVAHAFEAAVARLAFAARLLADNRGRLPHFGDDDGGMLLPICGRALDDVRDSLAEASALVDRPDLRIGDVPEEAHWMLAHPLLHPILEQSRAMPVTDAIGSAALPDTGYYISRSPAGDHLVVDAGAHGYENGGHAHADALSLTLSVRGVPLLIDPGTGSYTTDPQTRDTFRSSLLHNTVVVDGQSQSVPAGPFHWSRTAHAKAHVWRTNPGFDYLEASHDGYAPLEQRRHVLSLHGDLLIVADLVDGGGSHDVQAHWHLDPRWSVDVAGRRALLRTAGERVELAVSRGSVEQISGAAAPGIGWHAPVYGRLEPTSAIRVSDSGATPMWIVTVFGMNPANEVLVVEPVPIWARAGALERGVGVKISRTHSVDLFGVAERAQHSQEQQPPVADQTWRLAGYETDARMFFARSSESIARLAMVNGSLVRSADRHSLCVQLPRETPDLHLDFARPRGTLGAAARIGGQAFGAHVELGGRELPIAVERRALPRARARRALVK
jgi:hypothetical protein